MWNYKNFENRSYKTRELESLVKDLLYYLRNVYPNMEYSEEHRVESIRYRLKCEEVHLKFTISDEHYGSPFNRFITFSDVKTMSKEMMFQYFHEETVIKFSNASRLPSTYKEFNRVVFNLIFKQDIETLKEYVFNLCPEKWNRFKNKYPHLVPDIKKAELMIDNEELSSLNFFD